MKINLTRETESVNLEYLLSTSIDDYSDYLISKHSDDPLEMHYDQTEMLEPTEVRREGYRRPSLYNPSMLTGEISITIVIPFSGNRNLLDCKTNPFTNNPPNGSIIGNQLHLSYLIKGGDKEALDKEHDKRLEQIKKWISWSKDNVNSHNEWVKNNAKKIAINRKKSLMELQGFVESLDFPLKRDNTVNETYPLRLKRKKIEISKPKASTKPFSPEPSLEMEEYEFILETISSMSLAMERSPSTFSGLSETQIRDFFLIVLNSHYFGEATGETFNNKGKTDILIRHDNKNIFIAECKIWRGPNSLSGALDQIVSYSNWRDTKTSVLIFNKNKNFTEIIGKIETTISEHPQYKRKTKLSKDSLQGETYFSNIFFQPDDKNREMHVTVLAFNIPKPANSK